MTAAGKGVYRAALEEALPLYALGDVEPEDALAIEHALADDPESRDALRELTETAHQLALLAPTAAPPPGGLDRVWQRIDRVGEPIAAPPARAPSARPTRAPSARPSRAPSARPSRGPSMGPRPPETRRGRPLALAALAAAALVLFALFIRETRTTGALQGALDGALAQLAQDATERGALARQLDELRGQLDESRRNEVVRILQSPDLHVSLLGPREAGAAGVVRVLWRPTDASWLVVGSGLGPLPPDRDLQLWGLRAGRPTRAAVLPIGPDGTVHVRVRIDGLLVGSDTAAVTLEPKGGAREPTGPMLFAGTI